MLKRITIKDISERTGFSMTSVTKALNNKPKISNEVRKTILDTAAEMGYIPNRSAKAMASKSVRIGVAYSRSPNEFICFLEQGLNRSMKDLADYNVEIITRTFDKVSSDDQIIDILSDFADQNLNGVIFTPGSNYSAYKPQLHRLKELNIPVLLIISELDDPAVIGTIRLNARVAGGMAAQFLHLTIPHNLKTAVFVGNKDMNVHISCVDGFAEMAQTLGLLMCGVYETNDDRDIAYYLTNRVINEQPDLGGIYVSSYNSVGVCQWLEDNGMQKKIALIGHDLYPLLAEKLSSGTLTATLFQNQFEMGRKSLIYMYDYLTGARSRDDCSKLVSPQLVMASNLSCYHDYYESMSMTSCLKTELRGSI